MAEAECPVCSGVFKATKAGKIPRHKPRLFQAGEGSDWCEGSGSNLGGNHDA